MFGGEGTALRKTSAMVLGWEPVWGKGAQLNEETDALRQLLNFVGSTSKTRLLYACVHSMQALMEA